MLSTLLAGMQALVEGDAPQESPEDNQVQLPPLGPYPHQFKDVRDLAPGATGPTYTLGAVARWAIILATGNFSVKFDDDAQSATLDCELQACDLPVCSTNGFIYGGVFPVCNVQHLAIQAGAGCSIQYKVLTLGF